MEQMSSFLIFLLVIAALLIAVVKFARKKREMSVTESAAKSKRFQTLSAFGGLFSFLGWLVVIIAGIILFVGLIQLGERGPFGGGLFAMGSLASLPAILGGLILVALGQSISCFVSIESNTYAAMLAQQSVLSIIREQAQLSRGHAAGQAVDALPDAPAAEHPKTENSEAKAPPAAGNS